MRIDQFLKHFDFRYTQPQWASLASVIKAQPGKHDTDEIRETLEREARRYLVVPKLDSAPRRANRAHAKKVIHGCEYLKHLLSEQSVAREGPFETLVPEFEYAALVDKIEELRSVAEFVVVNNRPLSQKKRQADPRRDKYFATVCDLWVNTIGGRNTTSFDRRKGRATGPFVDFLFHAANPVLNGFTPNGAARFIKRWKKGMAV
jgi:hypothetical protein